MHVGRDRAVGAQPAHARGHVVARRHDGAPVAPRAEVLRREEAEAPGVAARPPAARPPSSRAPSACAASSTTASPSRVGQRRELRSGRAEPEEVHRHDRAHAQTCAACAARWPRATVRALAFIVAASTSQKTGRAPVAAMASAAATNENAGVTTASPAPDAERAQRQLEASVPDATPTAWSTPHSAASHALERLDARAQDEPRLARDLARSPPAPRSRPPPPARRGRRAGRHRRGAAGHARHHLRCRSDGSDVRTRSW